ncbi:MULTISPECIES: bifunctional aldolase/short-chain dehydrogenase [unclassified Cryobacterium]|uniref:bifunctional aldolase/short-chain dehydrogenase n=1 Tax=unclassified Cryobacterium TaxID=2649013 RepID=UPI00106BDF6C|nr:MULTISPECIES: bifunctional aldolase/short-chain dehydrogenase [unclassified Cryobacterium]TFB93104.1 bifunctional aldolase/short-chain dehydrogenase [Cryobacterium sp. MDB2-A-1]TFC05438.1 bifunctional aldolase/short-chain dehydrogenase [Cryobacterium sp. MDB2-33-2]TFC10743.1 bifunctional aldolase/short-chain dehydrogenase [Cryobacterium sp. MDB2-A-2]TFC13013.1 bifunctional aldolase/short-chain dehydrogenase [Cryobacterium sp. MDB2-10]
MTTNPTAAALVARSNRLGANPKNTNYAGGNTSAKGTEIDPVTGTTVELLWVKGSGGDLGTLTESGLAVLRLDRLRAMVDVYPGLDREDEMVGALDYALHGRGGAVPSIDTAMHGLVDAAHVDHLHPDAGIAIATAVDGEELTDSIFGHRVIWVPWRRPGFQLGLDIAAIKDAHPGAIGAILGGHGITAWGDTSEEAEANSLWIIETATSYIEEHSKPEPFGAPLEGFGALSAAERRAKAAALAPTLRGLVSTDSAKVGHFTDAPEVLDFLASVEHPRLAGLGTSCPDHFLRTKVTPLLLDLPADASVEASLARLHELHEQYRLDYQAYYDRHATPESPAIRGADPLIVLIPGVGMFSYGANKQTARVAGEFYINAIHVMRGAEGLSRYSPIDESEKFAIEYWALEEAKLQRMPKPKPLAGRIALVTGAASGIGKAIATRLAAEGACVVIADLELAKAQEAAAAIGGTDIAIGVQANVTDENQVQAGIDAAVLAFGGLDLVVNNAGLSLSKSLLETTVADWDLQHNVMAKGSFLVSRAAARVLIDQKLGGDIIYISSKNSVFAGPNNIAYSATKADQAHQVRLLAAELGEYGVKVNGINPDGVVRGSGIFAGGWGAKRAAVYGVDEQDLGKYYAQRTLLKREVLPENVANAVFVLCTSDLSHTTGLHIPVDAGVAAAFLR